MNTKDRGELQQLAQRFREHVQEDSRAGGIFSRLLGSQKKLARFEIEVEALEKKLSRTPSDERHLLEDQLARAREEAGLERGHIEDLVRGWRAGRQRYEEIADDLESLLEGQKSEGESQEREIRRLQKVEKTLMESLWKKDQTIEAQISRGHQTTAELEKQLTCLKTDLAAREDELAKLRKRPSRSEAEEQASKGKLAAAQRYNQALQMNIRIATEARAKAEHERDELREAVDALRRKVSEEGEEGSRAVQAEKERIAELEANVRAGEESLLGVEQALRDRTATAREEKKKLEARLEALTKEAEAAKEQLHEESLQSAKNARARGRLEDLEAERRSHVEKISALEKESETLRAGLEEGRKRLDTQSALLKRSVDREVELKGMRAERTQLQGETERLEKRMAERETEVSELRLEAEKLRQARDEMNGRIEAQRKEFEAKLAEIRKAGEADAEAMTAQLKTLREEKTAVEARASREEDPIEEPAPYRDTLEESLKEQAALKARLKIQEELFVELRNRMDNVQELIGLKEARIQSLEGELEERKTKDAKATRRMIREIKGKLEAEAETETKPKKDGWPEFMQLSRAGRKPKPQSRAGEEIMEAASRSGKHTPIPGAVLRATRGKILRRREIGRELHGISEGGIRISVDERLKDGEVIQVKITDPRFGDTVEADMKVQWCKEVHFGHEYDAELIWKRIYESNYRRVQRWLQHYGRPGR